MGSIFQYGFGPRETILLTALQLQTGVNIPNASEHRQCSTSYYSLLEDKAHA